MRDFNFYEKLLIVTLGPIVILGALELSYAGAIRWHRGTGEDATENRREAKVRHASAALLVLFLVGFRFGAGEVEPGEWGSKYAFFSIKKVIRKHFQYRSRFC